LDFQDVEKAKTQDPRPIFMCPYGMDKGAIPRSSELQKSMAMLHGHGMRPLYESFGDATKPQIACC